MVGVAVGALVRVASAQGELTPEEGVRVSYAAPSECPSDAEYIARVKGRAPRTRLAAPGELARQVAVTVSRDEEGYLARLDFVDVRGEAITRTLTGATCDEVVSGIALVTALALEAQTAPAAPTATSAAPPAPVEPPAPTRPEPPPAAPPPQASAAQPHPATRAPQRSGSRWRLGVGLGAGSPGQAAPGTPVGFDALLWVGRSDVSASGRLAVTHWRSSTTVDERSASFRGWGARLEGCPVAWPASGPLKVEPCAGLTLGALSGRGDASSTLPSTGKSTIFWADAQIIGRLRAAPSALFELEGEGFLGIPLRRHEFVFKQPPATVFEIPSVGAGFRVGLLLHFP